MTHCPGILRKYLVLKTEEEGERILARSKEEKEEAREKERKWRKEKEVKQTRIEDDKKD